MKKQIPYALVFSRLLFGFVLLYLSIRRVPHYPAIAIGLLTAGLLSDIFDGIAARRMGVSGPLLRRLDSSVDLVFFLCVAVATCIQCPQFFLAHRIGIGALLGAEALTYLVSFLRFRKEIATHSIGSKIWALLLFATLVQVMAQCDSRALFAVCLWGGLVTRMEILAIVLTLREWTNDVPSWYHALRLRQRKEIRRHKLFNG